jgi:hypothetical protein
MLESIPSGRGNYLSNMGCIVWLLCALLLGGWFFFMMHYCLNLKYDDNDKPKQESKSK